MAGTIVEGRNVAENRTLTPDFCIKEYGAAGGVCALKLTEAGFNVLVLEEGPNIPREKGTAPGHERKMLNSVKFRCTGLLPGGRYATAEKWRREGVTGSLSRRRYRSQLVGLFAATPRNFG